MKTKSECESHARHIDHQVKSMCYQKGHNPMPCSHCLQRGAEAKAAFEGCVPKAFWNVKPANIRYNREIFEQVVLKYVDNLAIALREGYGTLFIGDNGSGKSYFSSYILMQAIKRGRSVYYTTLPQLDFDIKRGFNDHKHAKRLEKFLLTSDFLMLDELGKVRTRNAAEFLMTQLERVMKDRMNNKMPILAASNMDIGALEHECGTTIGSMFNLLQIVQFEPGDYRGELAKKMRQDMGY